MQVQLYQRVALKRDLHRHRDHTGIGLALVARLFPLFYYVHSLRFEQDQQKLEEFNAGRQRQAEQGTPKWDSKVAKPRQSDDATPTVFVPDKRS